MIFQITHTHSPDTCPAVHKEKREKVVAWWTALSSMPDVAVRGAYASPLDHVFHLTIEAPDLTAVVRALEPLNALGTAQTSPVLAMDELLSLVGVSKA